MRYPSKESILEQIVQYIQLFVMNIKFQTVFS